MKEAVIIIAACLLGLGLAGSPRLPRTSADQRGTRNTSINNNITGNNLPPPSRNSQRNREQYLFNVFEVIVSTLESKLQRIENLDKAVEHLMRRVEALDSRVNDNIDKTEAVITKLRTLDLKLFNAQPILQSGTIHFSRADESKTGRDSEVPIIRPIHHEHEDQELPASLQATQSRSPSSYLPMDNLGEKLLSLDQKVSDIDNKLVNLKNQLDNNFLQTDEINAEASEKKPISMNLVEITKAMSNELMSHVTLEIENLRQTTGNMDRKLQFHMNLVSENLGAVYNLVSDVHEAVVDRGLASARRYIVNVTAQTPPLSQFYSTTSSASSSSSSSTSTTSSAPSGHNSYASASSSSLPPIKRSKLDRLVEQMHPMLTVSEKMDEVWNVVVGTKSSVDDLLPKSDELLTQTQRQERAISEIHADLRSKTNKIIENLEGVESRLRKQENDVATLAQRPIPAELLLDPTIDRLVEYDPSRYVGLPEEFATEPTITPPSIVQPNTVPSTASTPPTISTVTSTTMTTNGVPTTNSSSSSTLTGITGITVTVINGTSSVTQSSATISGNTPTGTPTNPQRSTGKNRGVIFPSVKNKPSPANSTFTTDAFLSFKDVKGYSCVDLLNAGMRDNGVYYLQIRGTTYWFLKVYCEQEIADGGWTVIQRRDDFGEPRENFNRDWADYKNGFGDPAREFWLGNENIYMLTNNEDYTLRVELEDFEGNRRYAQYSHFKIYSEGEYYKLEIDGYEGNAGDSLNDPWYGSNNSPFSTYNRDNDRSSLNCASMLKGGWWWKSCGRGLNGLYLNDPQDLTARQGIVWFRWRGWDYTLKRAMMMIKPKGPTATA